MRTPVTFVFCEMCERKRFDLVVIIFIYDRVCTAVRKFGVHVYIHYPSARIVIIIARFRNWNNNRARFANANVEDIATIIIYYTPRSTVFVCVCVCVCSAYKYTYNMVYYSKKWRRRIFVHNTYRYEGKVSRPDLKTHVKQCFLKKKNLTR